MKFLPVLVIFVVLASRMLQRRTREGPRWLQGPTEHRAARRDRSWAERHTVRDDKTIGTRSPNLNRVTHCKSEHTEIAISSTSLVDLHSGSNWNGRDYSLASNVDRNIVRSVWVCCVPHGDAESANGCCVSDITGTV